MTFARRREKMFTQRREGAKNLFAQRRGDATKNWFSLGRASGLDSRTLARSPAFGRAADAAEKVDIVASPRRRANRLLSSFAPSRLCVNQSSSFSAPAPSRESK